MAVEELRPGDLVLSRDEADPAGVVVAKEVVAVWSKAVPVLELHIGGHSIEAVAEHPFFRYQDGWVAAGDLRAGDRILTETGAWIAVDAVADTATWRPVFNATVADFHTYFVGCDEWGFSVWAHNACIGYGQNDNAAAQAAIAQFRVAQRYPVFDQANTDTRAVSVVRVGSTNYFAAAGEQGAWGEQTYPIVNRRRWLQTLKTAGLIPQAATLTNYQSLSHAEAMALMLAADTVGNATFDGNQLRMNVDRVTCAFCRRDGGIVALKTYLKLTSIIITDYQGTEVTY